MWRIGGLLWCLAATTVAAADQGRSSATPVAKVIQLLKKLSAQVSEEGTREAAGYDKYACFCKEQSSDKEYIIEKSRLQIETLTAQIEALDADITQLDTDVVAATKSITEEKDDAKTKSDTRETAFTTYQEDRKELTDGIDAITRAVQQLKVSRDDVKGQTELVQKALAIAAALQKKGGKQEPAKYEHRSGDIISTLEELNRTFKKNLATLDEEEAGESNQFNMVEGARSNRVKALEKEVFEKQQLSAEKGEEKATAEGLKTVEVEASTADQAFLDELTAACEEKSAAWDKRSKTRAGELTAITEAVGVLEGMGDLYETNKNLVGLAQKNAAVGGARAAPVQPHTVSLLQVAQAPAQNALKPVAKLLGERAASLKSSVLASLAAKVASSGPDHFVEVRALINDLISKLEAQASEEATQKDFCDTEMTAAVTKRDEQVGAIESNSASIDQTTSEISKLELDINTVADQIASLYKAKKELEELRSAEKAQNQKTIVDADAGAEALKQAITVLKNFYGSAGGALVQKKSVKAEPDREGKTVGDLAPKTFEGEYEGRQAESKGVLGLLEVIASDFERTSSTTTDAEATEEAAFQEQTGTMKTEIEGKEKDKETMENDVESKQTALIGFQDDLNDANKLHEEALKTLDSLKASCVEGAESVEERRAARKKEIAALKEALTILENWQG